MENETIPPLGAQPMTIINGGVELTVQFIDGTASESVKVRQLPLRLLPDYGNATGDEARLLELFTGKPAEWVDRLLPAHQEEIVRLGDELNMDPFIRWSERRLSAKDRMLPLVQRASGSLASVPPSVLDAATSRANSKS